MASLVNMSDWNAPSPAVVWGEASMHTVSPRIWTVNQIVSDTVQFSS